MKRNKVTIAVVGIASVLSFSAVAADWVQVFELSSGVTADDPFTTYVDGSSIRDMPSGYRRAWSMMDYHTHPEIRETRIYVEYDCNDGRSRILQHVTYFQDGEIEDTGIDEQPWSYAPPETNLSAQFNFVCSPGNRSNQSRARSIPASSDFVCCEVATARYQDMDDLDPTYEYWYSWVERSECTSDFLNGRQPAPASRGCSRPTSENANTCYCTNPAGPIMR